MFHYQFCFKNIACCVQPWPLHSGMKLLFLAAKQICLLNWCSLCHKDSVCSTGTVVFPTLSRLFAPAMALVSLHFKHIWVDLSSIWPRILYGNFIFIGYRILDTLDSITHSWFAFLIWPSTLHSSSQILPS